MSRPASFRRARLLPLVSAFGRARPANWIRRSSEARLSRPSAARSPWNADVVDHHLEALRPLAASALPRSVNTSRLIRSTSAPIRSSTSAMRSMIASISPRTPAAASCNRCLACRTGEELAEGAEIVVAKRRDAVAGDDDGERRDERPGDIDAGEQADGHVDRAVLGVEAARELDLLRLLAGQQAGAEKGFGGAILLGARLEHVHPGGPLRHAAALIARHRHPAIFGEAIGGEHLFADLRPSTCHRCERHIKR